MLQALFLFLCSIALILFCNTTFWRGRKKPPQFDRVRVGLNKTHISNWADTIWKGDSNDDLCADCEKRLYVGMQRVVAYDKHNLCYRCWKKWNFINVTERLILLQDFLPDDVLHVIKGIMLDEEWEVCDFEYRFPKHLRPIVVPHYKQLSLIDLALPTRIYTSNGDMLEWFYRDYSLCLKFYRRLSYEGEGVVVYALVLVDRRTNKQQCIEKNKENLFETLQLIQQLQYLYSSNK